MADDRIEFPALQLVERHVLLLGDALVDSIEGWTLTRVAAADAIAGAALPEDATHAVICLEGSRAIAESGLLEGEPAAYRQSLALLSQAADAFEQQLRALIDTAQVARLPVLVCTLPLPRYADDQLQQAATAALAIFNDRVARAAFAARLALADLRLVFAEPGDYSGELDLSAAGGRKLAELLGRALAEVDAGGGRSRVFI